MIAGAFTMKGGCLGERVPMLAFEKSTKDSQRRQHVSWGTERRKSLLSRQRGCYSKKREQRVQNTSLWKHVSPGTCNSWLLPGLRSEKAVAEKQAMSRQDLCRSREMRLHPVDNGELLRVLGRGLDGVVYNPEINLSSHAEEGRLKSESPARRLLINPGEAWWGHRQCHSEPG